MRRFLTWLATAATLTFAVPLQAGQNDPRLGPLFDALKAAATAEEAAPIEHTIWQIWLMSGNGTVDAQMLRGLQAMGQGRLKAALEAFDAVTTVQPDFAEGWNKRATVEFLTGRLDASVRDIGRTLELEPRHFGALSGLGMIEMQLGHDRQALKAFEAALAIYPTLPGAAKRVRDLRDKIRGKGI